jgi:hypothetical protein
MYVFKEDIILKKASQLMFFPSEKVKDVKMN